MQRPLDAVDHFRSLQSLGSREQRAQRLCLAQAWMLQGSYTVARYHLVRGLRTHAHPGPELWALLWISEKLDDESLFLQALSGAPFLRRYLPRRSDPIAILVRPPAKVRKAPWWGRFRGDLSYLLGRYYFLRGPRHFTWSRRFFAWVTAKAGRHRYLKSLYIQATMAHIEGKLKASRQLLFRMESASCKDLPGQRYSCGGLMQMARVGLARLDFALGRRAQLLHRPRQAARYFQGAWRYYRLSGLSDLTRFELSWTLLYMKRHSLGLKRLGALRKLSYRWGWKLERHVLESLHLYHRCELSLAKGKARDFLRKLKPLRRSLGKIVGRRRPRRHSRWFFHFFRSQYQRLKQKRSLKLPKELILRISRQREWRDLWAVWRRAKFELRRLKRSTSRRDPAIRWATTQASIFLRTLERRLSAMLYKALRASFLEYHKLNGQAMRLLLQIASVQGRPCIPKK